MPATTAGNPQTTFLTPLEFMNRSKKQRVKIASKVAYTDGATQTFNLPTAGLGHWLWVTIQGTYTLGGTVTSGTWQTYPYPVPFSIIKQVTFGSNVQVFMRQMTGWGWYKWIRARYGIDALSFNSGANFSANTVAALGISSTGRPVPGANVATGTFNINLTLPMPISFNQQAEVGLLVLQSNTTVFTLAITWGFLTGGVSATGGTNDLFNALVGTSLTYSASITTTIGLEWYQMVPGNMGQMTGFFMATAEYAQPLVAGTNIVTPPTNDFYTMLILEPVNNGAIFSVANINNLVWKHSTSIYDFIDDYLTFLSEYYWMHGSPPPDGNIIYDFGLAMNEPRHRDWIESYNNQVVTNLQANFDLPASTVVTAPSQTQVVMEILRDASQNQLAA